MNWNLPDGNVAGSQATPFSVVGVWVSSYPGCSHRAQPLFLVKQIPPLFRGSYESYITLVNESWVKYAQTYVQIIRHPP